MQPVPAGRVVVFYGGDFDRIRADLGDRFRAARIRSASAVCKTGKSPLPKVRPDDVILAIGAVAIAALQHAGLAKKNQSVKSLRQTAHELVNGAKLVVSYDPLIAGFDPARGPDIDADVTLVARLLRTGSPDAELGAYRWVSRLTDAVAAIRARFERSDRPVLVCLDLETVGLDPWADGVYVVCIGVSWCAGRSDCTHYPSADVETQPARVLPDGTVEIIDAEAHAALAWLLSNPATYVTGANFKFDMQWIARHYGITDFSRVLFDTTVVGSLLDENRNNSLNLHAKTYCPELGGYDDSLNATEDKSRMDLIDPAKLLPYIGGDVDAGRRVALAMLAELRAQPRLHRFFRRVMQPALQAFHVLERRGVEVDRARYDELRAELVIERDAAFADANALVPDDVAAWFTTPEQIKRNKAGAVVSRPDVVIAALFSPQGYDLAPEVFSEKKGQPSVSYKDHLHLFEGRGGNAGGSIDEFIGAVKTYGKKRKTVATFIDGFLKHLRSDGRYHPSYMLHAGAFGAKDVESGSVTGRSSCKEPPMQVVPKHTPDAKRLRSVFVPPPGHVLLNADFSQGELRVIACLAKVPSMIAAYRKGMDLHLLTGAELLGKTPAQALAQGSEVDELLAHEAAGRELSKGAHSLIEGHKFMRQGGKCFAPETELLTPGGWVRIDELAEGVPVMACNLQAGTCAFETPTAYQIERGKGTRVIEDRHTSLSITEDHRHTLFDRQGNPHTRELSEWGWQLDEWSCAHAARLSSRGDIDGWTSRLVVMVQADGHYNAKGQVEFGFSKARKVARCRSLLDRAGARYAVHVGGKGVTKITWHVRCPVRALVHSIIPDKRIPFGLVWRLDRDAVADELQHWDASPVGARSTRVSSTDLQSLTAYQTIVTLTGNACPLRLDTPPTDRRKALYTMTYRTDTRRRLTRATLRTPSATAQHATVYCLTVPSDAVLTRRNGKVTATNQCGNFGLIYGMGWRGFKVYAESTYGVVLTEEQAQDFRERFFAGRPELLLYHERQKREAARTGQVSTPLGRVRHLPLINSRDDSVRSLAERQSINSPTQGTLSDLGLLSIALLRQRHPELRVWGFTHDDVAAYVPADERDLWASRIRAVMERLPVASWFGWRPAIPFPVDMSYGADHMGKTIEFDERVGS